MKILLLILLACIAILIGYIFSKKYKTRYSFLQSLDMLCQKFDVEINFSRERLKNMFDSLEEKHKRNLYGIDKNFLSYLYKETSLDKESLFKNINFLKNDEKDVIFMFFKSLGRSDVDSQSKEIKNYQTRFESFSSTANNDNKKYGALSIKFGIIAGLFLIVLFI